MMDISRILAAKPVFDPEYLARETLTAKLIEWISNPTIFLFELPQLRAMVRMLKGQSIETKEHPIPASLELSRHMEWSAFTAVNRRELMTISMVYMGIDDKSCLDLFGKKGWSDISYAVDMRCVDPKKEKPVNVIESHEPLTGDEIDSAWSASFNDPVKKRIKEHITRKPSNQLARDLVTDLFIGILTENYFSGRALSTVYEPLHALMAAQRIAPLMSMEEIEKTVEFNVIGVIYYASFDDIPSRSYARLPEMILTRLGVDDSILERTLGAQNFQAINAILTKMRNGERNLDKPESKQVDYESAFEKFKVFLYKTGFWSLFETRKSVGKRITQAESGHALKAEENKSSPD